MIKTLFIGFLLLAISYFLPTTSYAFTIPGGEGTASADLPAPSGINPALTGGLKEGGSNLIQLGLNIILMLATLAAVLMIMISGIQMVTSKGDPLRLSAAKQRLFYAIIGLVISITAFFIVAIVLRLTGNSTNFLTKPAEVINP